MSISRAVALWNQQEATGPRSLPTVPRQAPPPGSFEELTAAWVEAGLAFDRVGAEQVFAQAFALYPPVLVCEQVIQRGLAEIGHRWYTAEITVHQEHFASELATRQVERLIGAAPAPSRSGRLLVGCVAGEQHTFGPLLLSLMLGWQGWDVVFLGANVPAEWYGVTRDQVRPALVILAAERLETAADLLTAAAILREVGLPLAYGGRVFNSAPSLRSKISGTFLGETLADAAAALEGVLARPTPSGESVPAEYGEAQDHFRSERLAIEAEVERRLVEGGLALDHLATANLNLAANLSAALSFGDLAALRSEMAWIGGLLRARELAAAPIGTYLMAYRQAARQFLDRRGDVIVAWLDQLLEDAG